LSTRIRMRHALGGRNLWTIDRDHATLVKRSATAGAALLFLRGELTVRS
jgi:hypothetical protein